MLYNPVPLILGHYIQKQREEIGALRAGNIAAVFTVKAMAVYVAFYLLRLGKIKLRLFLFAHDARAFCHGEAIVVHIAGGYYLLADVGRHGVAGVSELAFHKRRSPISGVIHMHKPVFVKGGKLKACIAVHAVIEALQHRFIAVEKIHAVGQLHINAGNMAGREAAVEEGRGISDGAAFLKGLGIGNVVEPLFKEQLCVEIEHGLLVAHRYIVYPAQTLIPLRAVGGQGVLVVHFGVDYCLIYFV